MALLARGREVAPHAAEAPRPVFGPGAARDLPLHLHHPEVSFRPVGGEGHREVTHEAEGPFAAAQQSVDEPAGRGERWPLLRRRGATSGRLWVEPVGSPNRPVVAGAVSTPGLLSEPLPPVAYGRGGRPLNLQ